MPREGASWVLAAEFSALPGSTPILRALIREADRLRLNRGW
ncbi:MAG: hypothetical protein ACM3X6_07350 [Patescibacteria group bacterium]